jgi:hypothetical protein
MLGKPVLFAIGGGVLAMVILIGLAGLRAAIILLKVLWLYPVVALIALLVLLVLPKLIRIPILNIALGLAGAVAICIFGFKGVTAYYGNSNMVFPSIYSADFIQELPDGRTPTVYEKRNKKGEVIAELSVGEKININGISFNYQEYNVTTVNGSTGWIERTAFPEDGADMLAISVGLDGLDSEETSIDRQTEGLQAKYLAVDREITVMDVPTKFYKMSDATLNRSTRINATAPLQTLDRKTYQKNGGELTDAGQNIVLETILYANDCTLLYLSVSETSGSRIWPLANGTSSLNTPAWHKSFIVKDLDTGETYPVMQGNYRRSYWWEKNGNGYKTSIVFVFPPFKSRHFSLTHEASPLPGTKKTGYGGILGWVSSMTGQDRAEDYYINYNFPEIRVR